MRKIRVLKLPLILCVLVSAVSALAADAAPDGQCLDKRVTDTMIFKQLVEYDPWQLGSPPPDPTQGLFHCSTGISNTPGGHNAQRAQALGAAKHFAEALGEWTRAINSYGEEFEQGESRSLDPNWLLSRARLYAKLGCTEDALKDAERALTLKRSYDQNKFKVALLFAELGEFSRAEAVLPATNTVQSLFQPYFPYLRAVVQDKQGKKDLAKQNYREAATLFAASGMGSAMDACFQATANINGPKVKKLTIDDLKAPKSNYDNMERLMKSLATRSDVFDLSVLKGLVGAASFQESRTGYFVRPYKAHYPEISLVTIDFLEGGGKRLNLSLETTRCSITKDVLNGILKNPVAVSNGYRPEIAHSEGYSVPAGTLVLGIRNGGFNPIWTVKLYSKIVEVPQPETKRTTVAPTPDPENSYREIGIINFLKRGEIERAENLINKWLTESPNDPRALMYQADVFQKKDNLDAALASIDAAIKYGGTRSSLNTEYAGNILLIRKGSYQLDNKQFEVAFRSFQQGFPAKPLPEQLLMRAKAEIGMNKFDDAYKDLDAASKEFYQASRIMLRDEADQLAESIRSKVSTSPARLLRLDDVSTCELSLVRAFVGEAQEEAQQKKLAQRKRYLVSLEKSIDRLILATPERKLNTYEYILALLEMERTARALNQEEGIKYFFDKAFRYFQTYTPRSDYDAPTRSLILGLAEFEGTDLVERLEKVANYTEPFCCNGSYREFRDSEFLRICRNENSSIAMLEKLIEIREKYETKTGIDAKSLRARFPKTYRVAEKQRDFVSSFSSHVRFVDKTSPKLSEEFAAASETSVSVEEILTLIEAKKFVESESRVSKLEEEITKRGCSEDFNKRLFRNQYLAVVDSYTAQGNLSLADKYFRKALSTGYDTTDGAVLFKEALSKLAAAHEKASQFAEAKSLYELVLEDAVRKVDEENKEISRAAAVATGDIKMKFAELLMAEARTQVSKSDSSELQKRANKLFEECAGTSSGKSNSQHLYGNVRLRQMLASIYPALVKLDLPHGDIVYEEGDGSSGSVLGGVSDGNRTIRIIGPKNISVNGMPDGRQSILMDGQTFLDKARSQFKSGSLGNAENLFVMALRAEPEADTFRMLGECWYKMGKKADAFQAASMALELDPRNSKAAALKKRCKPIAQDKRD